MGIFWKVLVKVIWWPFNFHQNLCLHSLHNPYGWHIEEPSGVDTEYMRMAYSSAICHPYGLCIHSIWFCNMPSIRGVGCNGVKYQVKPRFKNHIEHIWVLYDSAVRAVLFTQVTQSCCLNQNVKQYELNYFWHVEVSLRLLTLNRRELQ